MKELFAAFGNEVFRPLVTLLIPGGIVVMPYFIYFRIKYEALQRITDAKSNETTFVLVLLSLFAGLVIEDLGTHIESGWDEPGSAHDRDWFRYLRLAFTTEPVGHRYLRTLVLRLKFELAGYVSLSLAFAGFIWLGIYAMDFPNWLPLAFAIIGLGLWLRYEARCSYQTLQKLRREMLKGVVDTPGIVPIDPETTSPNENQRRRDLRISIAIWAILGSCNPPHCTSVFRLTLTSVLEGDGYRSLGGEIHQWICTNFRDIYLYIDSCNRSLGLSRGTRKAISCLESDCPRNIIFRHRRNSSVPATAIRTLEVLARPSRLCNRRLFPRPQVSQK